MSVKQRYELKHYMNTGTVDNPNFSLINEGVTTFDSSLEPQTEDVHFVAEQNARTQTTGVNASYSFTAGYDPEDVVSTLLYNICASQNITTEVEVVHVEGWGTDPTALIARKMMYSVSPSKEPSGDPGAMLTMEGTLNQIGSIVIGTFDVSDKTFTPSGY